MEITVKRQPADGDTLPGDLFVDGKRFSATLERTSKAIPLGTYRLQFTESARATRGELWSPDGQHRLPLLTVPGRDGIRIHAANYAAQLLGCIALGDGFAGPNLYSSRVVVARFIESIRGKDDLWISVELAPSLERAPRVA